MALVKINGVTYELDTLSDEVKTHLKYLSYIDSEIERLKMQLGTFHLSRDHVGRLLDISIANHAMQHTPFENSPPVESTDSADKPA